MSKTIAVVCVRMGSERLGGKMMLEALGTPLLGHLLRRVRQAKRIDGIVVATPDSAPNDVIAAYCASIGVPCFRGSEADVMGRMLGALESMQADVGVEVYGDSPLIDPTLIDECISVYREGKYDWVGNDVTPVYPSGMYSETFSMTAFRDAAKRNLDPAIREHGTLYLRQHPELYRQKHIAYDGPLRRTDIHLDIDTSEDFALFETVLTHFAPRTDFTLGEIIGFLDAHPEIASSNAHVHRRWKQYQKPFDKLRAGPKT